MSYTTYSITIRPRGGAQEQEIDTLAQFTFNPKYCKHAAVSIEKEGTEGQHLHIALICPEPKLLSNIRLKLGSLYKYIKDDDRCVKLVGGKFKQGKPACAIVVEPWYNDDWYNYVTKENTPYLNTLPPLEEIQALYPPANDSQLKRKHEYNIWYNKLKDLWEERDQSNFPNTHKLKEWLTRLMLDDQIEIISDKKKFAERLEWLRRKIEDDDTHPPEECYGQCNTCHKRKHLLDFHCS